MQGCPGGCRDARCRSGDQCRRDAQRNLQGAVGCGDARGVPVAWGDVGCPRLAGGGPAAQWAGCGAEKPPPRAGGLLCVCPIVLGWGQGPSLPGDRGSSPLLLPRGGGSAASPPRSPWPWGCSAVSAGEGQLIPWGRPGLGARDRDGLGWADRGRLWKRVNVRVSVHISVHGAASLFPRPHRHAHQRERGFGMATAGECWSGAVGSQAASKPCGSTQNPRYWPMGCSQQPPPWRQPGHSALSSPQPHYLQAHLWICFHSPLLQAREGKRGAGLVSGTWEQNPRGLHRGNGGARGSSPLLIWQLPRGLSQAGWLRGATGCSEPSRDCASPVPKGLTAEDVMLINIVGASGEVLG